MVSTPSVREFQNKSQTELIYILLSDPRYRVNEADRKAMAQALGLIDQAYEYKKCHLASVGVFDNSVFVPGLQVYCRRKHEFNQCAEAPIIAHKHMLKQLGRDDALLTIATYHGSHDKEGRRIGLPYLIPPCEACVRLLEQVAPNCLVIIDVDGDGTVLKIPLNACTYFQHPRCHNGE